MSERSKFIYQLSRLYNGSFREVAWRLGESWCNWIGLLYTALLVRHLPRINLFQRLWESHPVKNLEQTRAANGKSGVWLRCFIHRLIAPMHQTCIRVMHVWCIGEINRWRKQRSLSLKKLGIKWLNVTRRETAWWQLQIADCRIDSIKNCQENEHSWARLTVTSIHNEIGGLNGWGVDRGAPPHWGIGQKKVVSHVQYF